MQIVVSFLYECFATKLNTNTLEKHDTFSRILQRWYWVIEEKGATATCTHHEKDCAIPSNVWASGMVYKIIDQIIADKN